MGDGDAAREGSGQEDMYEADKQGIYEADKSSGDEYARQAAEGGPKAGGMGTGEMSLAEYLTASGRVHEDSPNLVDQSTDLQEIAGVKPCRAS